MTLVIPAQAGIQMVLSSSMDSGLHRNDVNARL